MVKVSIIIPSYNRKNDLERCLNSIINQSFKDYEITIVDNDSKDNTRKFLEEMKIKLNKRLRLIYNNFNVGASEARNQALRIVNSEFVLFLDSDAELNKKDILKNMLKIMRADRKIGQLGAEIIEGRLRIPNSQRNEDGIFIWRDKAKMYKTQCITTANCFMRTEIIKEIGGFDPHYIYGYEDNDLSWRIRKAGLKCIIDDRVAVIHHVSFTARTSSLFRFHRNRVRFLIKKETPLFLFFLPIVDIITTIKLTPERIKEFASKPLDKIAWLNKNNKKEPSKLNKLFTLGFNYSTNLIKAYFWNIINLKKTWNIRKKEPNFILKNEIKTKNKNL